MKIGNVAGMQKAKTALYSIVSDKEKNKKGVYALTVALRYTCLPHLFLIVRVAYGGHYYFFFFSPSFTRDMIH